MNKDFFSRLNFSFDHYSRTTWEGHASTVQAFFLDLLQGGFIEEKVTEQLFSSKKSAFWPIVMYRGLALSAALIKRVEMNAKLVGLAMRLPICSILSLR